MLQSEFTVSQRRACAVVGQSRSSQRYQPKIADDEPKLIEEILDQVRQFPRCGYRMICAKLRQLGWTINPKRVYRLWKELGLKVPVKKRKKRRLGESKNASHRHRADHPIHVWSWDFVFDRTTRGKALKWLVIVDEFTRENLCLEVGYQLTSEAVIDYVAKLIAERGVPRHIRSDNGPEFIANALKDWFAKLGIETLYIAPGSPWENAFAESFNSRFRDEFLALEVFDSLSAAKQLTAQHQSYYNELRPHSSLDYRTPVEFARQFSASSAGAPEAENCRLPAVSLNQPVLS